MALIAVKACKSGEDKCDPPAKPTGLSEDAEWVGGCDGGNWIELVSIGDNKYRFRVYRDWDGALNIDSDFIVENCETVKISKTNWQDLLAYYNHDASDSSVHIFLKGGDCYLKSIFPAYGGEDWDEIRNKSK